MLDNWDDRLLTGDAPIDDQHRQAYSLTHELAVAVAADADIAYVRDVLDRLTAYADTHFLMEERLMEATAYPEPLRAAMIREHRDFVAFVRQHVLDYRRGALLSASPLLEYLNGWWDRHILDQDCRLAEHIRARRSKTE